MLNFPPLNYLRFMFHILSLIFSILYRPLSCIATPLKNFPQLDTLSFVVNFSSIIKDHQQQNSLDHETTHGGHHGGLRFEQLCTLHSKSPWNL